jgi:hypothetical protein
VSLHDLRELQVRARVRLELHQRDPTWRAAHTFARESIRALRSGQPAHIHLKRALTPYQLRELEAWLRHPLKQIAAQALGREATEAPLSFAPVLSNGRWGPPPGCENNPRYATTQLWRANGTPPFSSTLRGLHVVYVALVADRHPIDGTALLAPGRAADPSHALRDVLDTATTKIRSVSPRLAHALDFEITRTGGVRYAGIPQISTAV